MTTDSILLCNFGQPIESQNICYSVILFKVVL